MIIQAFFGDEHNGSNFYCVNISGITTSKSSGTEDGIQLGKNILTWEKFGLMLETSPIKTFYLASCYSDRVKPYTSKQVFGFQGEIDVYVAGIDISKQIVQTLDQKN